jgi:hypothetical protein
MFLQAVDARARTSAHVRARRVPPRAHQPPPPRPHRGPALDNGRPSMGHLPRMAGAQIEFIRTEGSSRLRCNDGSRGQPRARRRRRSRSSRKGASIVCLPELFRTQLLLPALRTPRSSTWRSRSRPTTERMAALAKQLGVVVIASLFERRAAGVYHNTPSSSTPTGASPASTGRCTSPTTRSSTRSSTSRPATSASAPSTRRRQDRHARLLGPVVPGGARLTALAGADVLFYPTAIGWHPREKAEFGERRRRPWQTMPALARDRERRVRRGREPRRPRGCGRRRHRVLGRRRSSAIRSASSSRGAARRGSRPRRRVRSEPAGGRPAELALPPRPPHRRLRRITQRLLDDESACRGAARRQRSASACRPSGSRTPRPGSRGRTSAPTGRAGSSRPFAGSTARSVRQLAPGERVRILVAGRGGAWRSARSAQRIGRRGRTRRLPPRADRSLVDARQLPLFVRRDEATSRRSAGVQRVGKYPNHSARREGTGAVARRRKSRSSRAASRRARLVCEGGAST